MPISVAHVLFRFAIGGLENGVVNLINRLPEPTYRHYILCLTDYDPGFVTRLRTRNYEVFALHKREGHDPRLWLNAYKLLRRLRPQVLHTRNFVSLELQLAGIAAGVRGRVHGEHGWDVQDLDGHNRKYQLARRVIGAGVHRFIALSRHLEDYLLATVQLPRSKVIQIYNGVDDTSFCPRAAGAAADELVIGTVGRMQEVKNQTLLVRAFIALVRSRPDLRTRLRLRLVGSGPLVVECQRLLAQNDLADRAAIVGDSDQVADEMRAMDIFVLPSLAEGISNTILEAMATGLPVIATRVGGNPELVVAGETGLLIERTAEQELVAALARYCDDPRLRQQHGAAGRRRIEAAFSMHRMVEAYDGIYRDLARSS